MYFRSEATAKNKNSRKCRLGRLWVEFACFASPPGGLLVLAKGLNCLYEICARQTRVATKSDLPAMIVTPKGY